MTERALQVRPDLDYHEAYEALDHRLRGLAGVLIGMSMDADTDAPVSDAAAEARVEAIRRLLDDAVMVGDPVRPVVGIAGLLDQAIEVACSGEAEETVELTLDGHDQLLGLLRRARVEAAGTADRIAQAILALDAVRVADRKAASDADLERLLFEAQAVAGQILYEQQTRRQTAEVTP